MIFVIMPVHNRIKFTLDCLKCFENQTYKEFKLYIVDDGSTDNSEQTIKKLYPEIDIIKGNGSWWWAKSLNQGLRVVLPQTKQNDFVLIINNDTSFDPNYLNILVQTSTSYGRAITGSLVYKSETSKEIQDAGVITNWSNFTFPKSTYDTKKKFNDRIDALSTRGLLIPVEVFLVLSRFSQFLPHHATDYDFTIRAKRNGFRLIMSYEAIINNTESDGEKQFSLYDKYFNRRSSSNIKTHIIFALRNAPTLLLKIKCVVIIYVRFIKTIINHYLKNE